MNYHQKNKYIKSPNKIFMKKILLLLVFSCVSNLLPAQEIGQQKTDSVCLLIKKYFNEKNSDKIYALVGEVFKNAISANAFKNFCDNNLFPIGEMKETVLENY